MSVKNSPVWSLMYFHPPEMWRFMRIGTLFVSACVATRGDASWICGMSEKWLCRRYLKYTFWSMKDVWVIFLI